MGNILSRAYLHFWDIMMFWIFAFVTFWYLHTGTWFTWLTESFDYFDFYYVLCCYTADCTYVVAWLRLVCRTANSGPMGPAIRHIHSSWYVASKPREQWCDTQRQTFNVQTLDQDWTSKGRPSTVRSHVCLGRPGHLFQFSGRHVTQTCRLMPWFEWSWMESALETCP